MSKAFTSGDGSLARKRYHHGNLREALIEAARFLITERGPQGFTLIEAARLVNVSPAAPYRHFKDRDALVAEVARRGADAFQARMRAAADAAGRPEAAFEALGRAYLAFAREEPGLYAALFAAPLSDDACPPPREAEGILDLLAGTLRAIRPDIADPMAAALAIWSLSHGIAELHRAGKWPASGPRPEDVLSRGGGALIRGAGS